MIMAKQNLLLAQSFNGLLKEKIDLGHLRINDDDSKGKLFNESFLLYENGFSDDRFKIIYSNSFRKLGYKTQVVFNNEGDYHRTRLTHSLEVAQIASSMCSALNLNNVLSECIALSHDLGHTPFGHCGEDGLNEILSRQNYPLFNHNVQSLKIVTYLEKKLT